MTDEIITIAVMGQNFSVLRGPIERFSKTLKDLIENCKDLSMDVIPLGDSVTPKAFEHIIEWTMQHKDDPVPSPPSDANADDAAAAAVAEEEKKDNGELTEWDTQFFDKLSQDDKFQVIMATNYLSIKPMLDASCRIVARTVLGKTPAQIYQQFQVTEPLTEAEQEEIRKENPWLEDN